MIRLHNGSGRVVNGGEAGGQSVVSFPDYEPGIPLRLTEPHAQQNTVREAFVMAAMQGLLARDQRHEGTSITPTREDTAVEAIRQADATLAAMEKGDEAG